MSSAPAVAPLESAGFFSQLFYTWATPLFRLGFSRALKMEDLWPVRTSERSEIAGKALQQAWAAELAAAGPNARLSSAYIAAWKRWYISPITWSLMWVCFGCLSSAVLMRTIILWFENQGGHSSGFILGVVFALMISEICKSVCLGQMWYGSNMGALQMRAATRYIVFEKLTKMRVSDVDVGNVVTLAMNDAQRMQEAGSFTAHFVMGPAAALAVIIVLLRLLGVAVLAGVVALVALIPLQRGLAKAVGRFRARTIPITSERTGAMNEALNGIKLIKLYAWEGSFADAIGRLRAKELDMLFLAGCAQRFALL